MAIPSPVITLLAFAVALGVLVFVHELGHFLVAKRLGVKVLRFSIGFGPLLFAAHVRRDRVRALAPFRSAATSRCSARTTRSEARAEPARAFSHPVAAARRSAIVFAGPAMNFLFAFLAYAVLFAHGGCRGALEPCRASAASPRACRRSRPACSAGDRVVAIDGSADRHLGGALAGRARLAGRAAHAHGRPRRRARSRSRSRPKRKRRQEHLRRGQRAQAYLHRHRGVARLDRRSGPLAGDRHGRRRRRGPRRRSSPRGCS